MYRELLIIIEEEDTTIALMDDRQLSEIYFQQSPSKHLIGNIYKGVVENVLPGMQAAFVDIGLEKNSFLYVDDVLPPTRLDEETVSSQRHSIDELLKVGQEVLVQVFKEPYGSKGARVTMQYTLPGRYLVLLPNDNYIAVSRRIEDNCKRERLKELVKEILPKEMGVIIRTVAENVGQEELAADLKLLVKQWRRIQGKSVKSPPLALIHRDLDLLKRIIRDTNAADLERIVVNSWETAEKVKELIIALAPTLLQEVIVRDDVDLFDEYDIFGQMEKALRRKVWLKSGGYIVFDQMEALTAVDVNTGKYVGSNDLSETIFKTNAEAAVEIARQLRLRNIGGIIIVDFIDMENIADKQKLLALMETELKKDRTRVTLMGMTQLGLIEMTRKKIGHDISHDAEKECPFCAGKGRIFSEETMVRFLKRQIEQQARQTDADTIYVEANPLVVACLAGMRGRYLNDLEQKINKKIIVTSNENQSYEQSVVRPQFDD